VRFLSALTARVMDTKSFCFRRTRYVKCAGDHPTTNCSCRKKSKNVKCVLCEGNHPANYKGYMVYKDLRRNFFTTLRRKVIICESQTQTEPTNIQIRHIQPGRLYASLARTDSKQYRQETQHLQVRNNI